MAEFNMAIRAEDLLPDCTETGLRITYLVYQGHATLSLLQINRTTGQRIRYFPMAQDVPGTPVKTVGEALTALSNFLIDILGGIEF
jgi:hypothetical protein